MMALPRKIDEVDADFLTRALASRQPGTVVADVTHGELLQGSATGLPLAITYAANPTGLADRLFLKGDFIEHGILTHSPCSPTRSRCPSGNGSRRRSWISTR